MTEDNTTKTLYLSSLLPTSYPLFWTGFKETLERNQIKYKLFEGTKDVWVRDYMPVQITDDKYVQFRYRPDYYSKSNQDKITVQEDAIPQTGLQPVQTDIILNGGNVVKRRKKAILISKIFSDNPEINHNVLIERLKTLLEVEQVIIIPARPVNETGHGNGTASFIDENKVLMIDYPSDNNGNIFTDGVRAALLTAGLEIIPMPCLVDSGLPDDTCGYIQFLQLGHVIFVPQFGTKEDQPVLDLFEHHFAGYKIEPVDCTELAKAGGSLNRISWTIYDHNMEVDWEDLFENKRQRLTEELQQEIDTMYMEDDGESRAFKRREKFSEICHRRLNLMEQLIPEPYNPSSFKLLDNSFKKELAKRFYDEWTASNGEGQFIAKKSSNFIKKVVPELRHNFRLYMKHKKSSYYFTYQPEFIDASNEEIVGFLAENTAYSDFLYGMEQQMKQEKQIIDAEKKQPYNYSKLVLLFHFFFLSIGIDPEQMIKSSIARFIHLLFGIPYTDLKKTKTIYDKIRAAPLVTKDDTLVEYLSDVKTAYKKYDLDDAAALVDVYLTESIKEKNKKN